ncbi:hypothetical protein ACTSKR_02120 [Chitinibacteraceae bacterium HSL-7]
MTARVLVIGDRSAFSGTELADVEATATLTFSNLGPTVQSDVAELHPDIVLIVGVGDNDQALMLCQLLRETHPELWIYLVSDDGGHDTRQTAYEAGADDLLVLPLRTTELPRKLKRLSHTLHHAVQLRDDLHSANQVALTAIANSGEMGGVINFIKQSEQCSDIESLAQTLVAACTGHFGRQVVVQVREDAEHYTINSEGRSSPLEAEMLAGEAETAPRISQYHQRLLINFPAVTLRIRDLPDDEAYVGRIRDHVAIMVEAAAARVAALQNQHRLEYSAQKTNQALDDVRNTLEEIKLAYRMQQNNSRMLLTQMKEDLERAMIGFGLTERQEEQLRDMLDASSALLMHLHDLSFELEDRFGGIITTLSELAQLTSANVIPTSETPPAPPPADTSVELF